MSFGDTRVRDNSRGGMKERQSGVAPLFLLSMSHALLSLRLLPCPHPVVRLATSSIISCASFFIHSTSVPVAESSRMILAVCLASAADPELSGLPGAVVASSPPSSPSCSVAALGAISTRFRLT